MNKRQADMVFNVIYQRPEIRSLFDFWRAGKTDQEGTWPEFLREVAGALSPPTSAADMREAPCRKPVASNASQG